jgi:SAM-dependent methyltransferase
MENTPTPSGINVVSSRWTSEQTVQAFVSGTPNQVLMARAAEWLGAGHGRLLDLGCGAARNAVPLAELGFDVTGVDLSEPMIRGARGVAERSPARERLELIHGPMTPLPFADEHFDAVVAHGIWNLCTNDDQLRRAIRDAARVARPGAPLFVFTFSRHTVPEEARPVDGQEFIYTQFSGEPQCFLTRAQLIAELADAGWQRGSDDHLVEYNRPKSGLRVGGPVIYEGFFTRA